MLPLAPAAPTLNADRKAPAFRNIRYAYAERFEPADVLPYTGQFSAERGPVPPQLPSRLAIALGRQAPLSQSEDCQVLSVFAPGSGKNLPVLVWFHGGAHVSGGGELPWYDGARLAAEQNIIVVTVGYRLGALGNYYGANHSGPSPATTDQMAAIEWVHRNIDSFGGDPQRITLAGQSAGAFSIEVMLRWGLGPHVTGAILQSGNLKDPQITYTPDSAREHTKTFEKILGRRNPRDLPVDQLLDYEQEFIRLHGGITWAPARPNDERNLTIPILGGWTSEDDLPFTMMSHGLNSLTWPERHALEEQSRSDTTTLYITPTLDALRQANQHGALTWAYQFDWSVHGSPWGSPHCMELPFLFNNWEAWQTAPMLNGAEPSDIARIGRPIRHAWAKFVHNANPGPAWTPWTPNNHAINQLPQE